MPETCAISVTVVFDDEIDWKVIPLVCNDVSLTCTGKKLATGWMFTCIEEDAFDVVNQRKNQTTTQMLGHLTRFINRQPADTTENGNEGWLMLSITHEKATVLSLLTEEISIERCESIISQASTTINTLLLTVATLK